MRLVDAQREESKQGDIKRLVRGFLKTTLRNIVPNKFVLCKYLAGNGKSPGKDVAERIAKRTSLIFWMRGNAFVGPDGLVNLFV